MIIDGTYKIDATDIKRPLKGLIAEILIKDEIITLHNKVSMASVLRFLTKIQG